MRFFSEIKTVIRIGRGVISGGTIGGSGIGGSGIPILPTTGNQKDGLVTFDKVMPRNTLLLCPAIPQEKSFFIAKTKMCFV